MTQITSIQEFIMGLIAYGGGATVIAYFVFQFLGKTWLETKFSKELENFRHEKAIEIERLRVEVESLLSGKIKLQEQDFAILPEAWKKLNIAHKLLASTTSPFQQYPDLNRYSQDELDEFLTSTDFSKSVKLKIKNSSKPLEPYTEAITFKRINEVRKAIFEFKDFADTSGIFMEATIKQKFDQVADKMWSAIVSKEVGHEVKDWKMQREAWKELEEQVKPIIIELESAINSKLTSHSSVLK